MLAIAFNRVYANFPQIAFTILLLFIVKYFLDEFDERRKFPKGPLGLPLLGYLPFVTSKPHKHFAKLALKYGPVFSLKLGTERFVILNSFDAIQDAFRQDSFSGRPTESVFNALMPFECK